MRFGGRAGRGSRSLVAALVIIGVAIGMFYNLAKELGSKENRELLAQKANERAKDTGDRALKEARATCRATPARFSARPSPSRWKRTCPRTGRPSTVKVWPSRTTWKTNLTRRSAPTSTNPTKYQAILREEFPDLQNPELLDKMYASVTDIMDRLTSEYYSDKVRGEIEGINDKWLKMEMADVPRRGDLARPAIHRQPHVPGRLEDRRGSVE